MIVHLYVPEFPAHVQARSKGMEEQPVAICDEARILFANPAARKLGCRPGQLLEKENPASDIALLEFDLPEVKEVHYRLRRRLEKLSPIVENLELGEFFLEIDDQDKILNWFNNLGYDFPLTGGAAATGWLARIVSRRQDPGDFEIVKDDDYETSIKKVKIDEIWGFGSEFKTILKEKGFKEAGELYHLQEAEKRKLLGSDSRLLHKVFNKKEPRSINVFSRPRSLSRELAIPPDIACKKEKVIEKIDPVLKKFRTRLKATVSLAYRLRLGLRFENQQDLVRSHIFTTPVDDSEMFRFALRQMMAPVALTVPLKTVVVETDVIVADLENYHRKPREAAMSFEIIDN